MLGKCLYEGMLLELPLADFFLKKMRGGVCDINDMPSLDPEVYKHLLQLRHYQGVRWRRGGGARAWNLAAPCSPMSSAHTMWQCTCQEPGVVSLLPSKLQ